MNTSPDKQILGIMGSKGYMHLSPQTISWVYQTIYWRTHTMLFQNAESDLAALSRVVHTFISNLFHKNKPI